MDTVESLVKVQVRADASTAYGKIKAVQLVELAAMLSRFKQSSDANKIDARVTIAPHDTVPHRIIIRVMDACAKAGIESVNFAMGED